MKKKYFTVMLIIVFCLNIVACGKEETENAEQYQSSSKSSQSLESTESSKATEATTVSTTQAQSGGIITILERSKASKDLQDADNIRACFLIALYEPEVWEKSKEEVESVGAICFEIKDINGNLEIACQNSTKMGHFIDAVKKNMNYSMTPGLKKDLDGSGVVQSRYYAVLEKGKDLEVSVYISGEGKTMKDLQNDTDGDGVYQCSPNICKEYTWR